ERHPTRTGHPREPAPDRLKNRPDSPSAYQPRTGCRTGQTPPSAHRLRTDGRTGQIPIRFRTRTSTGRLRESDSLRTGFGRTRRSARLPIRFRTRTNARRTQELAGALPSAQRPVPTPITLHRDVG